MYLTLALKDEQNSADKKKRRSFLSGLNLQVVFNHLNFLNFMVLSKTERIFEMSTKYQLCAKDCAR